MPFIAWATVFLLIKPQRIKELLPIGLIAAFVLFVTDEVLITIGAIKFKDGLLPVAGQPLFHLIWGAGGGILLMNFIKEEFIKKIPLILLFALATVAFEYAAELTGSYITAKTFTNVIDIGEDVLSLSFLVWISEGVYGNRIHKQKDTI